jgi:hypothetical protein
MPDTAIEPRPRIEDLPPPAAEDDPLAPPGPTAAPLRYPRPLVFLHIPKAAGTTLQDFILRHYFPLGRVYRFTGAQDQHEQFLRLPQAERDTFDVLSGHVHFGIDQHLSRPATYMTMLRDPIERVISAYYFILANPEHYLFSYVAGRGYTLHEYATMGLNQESDNDQVRWLTPRLHSEVPLGQVTRAMLEEAKWNLQNAITVFGLADRFTDSLRCFSAAFGWEPAGYSKRLNSNRARPKRDQVAPETIEAIRESNRYDMELYECAQGLFEDQMVRLGVRPARAG